MDDYNQGTASSHDKDIFDRDDEKEYSRKELPTAKKMTTARKITTARKVARKRASKRLILGKS